MSDHDMILASIGVGPSFDRSGGQLFGEKTLTYLAVCIYLQLTSYSIVFFYRTTKMVGGHQ